LAIAAATDLAKMTGSRRLRAKAANAGSDARFTAKRWYQKPINASPTKATAASGTPTPIAASK